VFRFVLLLIGLSSLSIETVTAQILPVRARDYLFLTNVADVRALWVNPAGLGIVPEASIFGELTFDRTSGDLRVEQYSLGFNSRGFALGYQRNRFVDEESVGILRTGFGYPLRRGALGGAVSRYSQDSTKTYGLEVGLAFIPRLKVPLQLGAVVRHIGRPTVRGQDLPVTGIGAVQLSTSHLQINLAHRAGARVMFGAGRLPIILIGAVDLGSNMRIDEVNVGFSIGGPRQVTAMGSLVEQGDNPVFQRFSGTLVATNPIATAGR
jgi:hypothetical protein